MTLRGSCSRQLLADAVGVWREGLLLALGADGGARGVTDFEGAADALFPVTTPALSCRPVVTCVELLQTIRGFWGTKPSRNSSSHMRGAIRAFVHTRVTRKELFTEALGASVTLGSPFTCTTDPADTRAGFSFEISCCGLALNAHVRTRAGATGRLSTCGILPFRAIAGDDTFAV